MLGKRIFVRIGLQVFAGILCSLLISCGSAETTPQPNLYTLEEALTLAAQTLQAESRVATASKTPTQAAKADVSNEQTESEENPEEPVVPVTGGNDEEAGTSNFGNYDEGTDASIADSPEAEPKGENEDGDRKSMLLDENIRVSDSYSVDKNNIIPIFSPESLDTSSCHYEATNLCGAEKIEFLQNYQISSVPSPTIISDPDVRKEDQEEPSNVTVVQPPAPIEIPPLPPITLPGQPPLPPFPPPIFP